MGDGRKAKRLTVCESVSCDYSYYHQRVTDEDGTELFVRCGPFDANGWIDAVRYGFELARQGYDEIDVRVVKDRGTSHA